MQTICSPKDSNYKSRKQSQIFPLEISPDASESCRKILLTFLQAIQHVFHKRCISGNLMSTGQEATILLVLLPCIFLA